MANYAQGKDYQSEQSDLQKKLNEKQQQLQQAQGIASGSGGLLPMQQAMSDVVNRYFQPGVTQAQQGLEASQKEQQYARDLAQATEQQRNLGETTARQGLAQNLAGIKRDTSARGLLHSGIKQAQDVGAINQAGAEVAGGAAKAAQTYRDKLAGYRGEQVNRGLDEYQLAQEKAASDYNTALTKRKAALANRSGIGKSIGEIGGTIAGAALLPF